MDALVSWVASHAVAAIEQSAISTTTTSSRVKTLRRITASRGEFVADAVDGDQVLGRAGVRLDLAAQVLDVRVDGAGGEEAVDAVHAFQQLLAAEHPAHFGCEH